MIASETREGLRLAAGYLLTILCVLLMVAATDLALHLSGFTLYVPTGITR